jgi:hypothetical protein
MKEGKVDKETYCGKRRRERKIIMKKRKRKGKN